MPTPLQSKSAGADAASISVTFTAANLSPGSKLIAIASGGGSGVAAISSVTATGGNTLTLIGSASQANARVYIYAVDAAGSGGTSMVGTKPTVTAAWAATVGGGLVVQEVPGLLAGNTAAMADGTAGTLTGTAASTGSPAYTDTAPGQYKLAAYGDFGSGVTVSTAAGWTPDPSNINTSTSSDALAQYKNSAGGSETDGYTGADSGGWAVAEIAFRLAGATAA